MVDPSIAFKEERVTKPHSNGVRWSVPFDLDEADLRENRSTRAPSRPMARSSQLEAPIRQPASSMPQREMSSTPLITEAMCVHRLVFVGRC